MLHDEFLYQWDASLIAAGLFLLFLAAGQVGFRLGRFVAKTGKPSLVEQAQAIEGAILTLLGLMLAFTFSMASLRHDQRKQILLQEANALGTSYLRASLLPSDDAVLKQQGLIKQYVATRLRSYRSEVSSVALDTEAAALQARMWEVVATNSRASQNGATAALLVTAMNDVIDLSESQTMAFANHVPEDVLLFLFVLSVAVISLVAYLNGLNSDRQRSLTVILAGVITMTLFLVLDLDRPKRGLIRLDLGSLERLQVSLERSL